MGRNTVAVTLTKCTPCTHMGIDSEALFLSPGHVETIGLVYIPTCPFHTKDWEEPGEGPQNPTIRLRSHP